VEVAQREIEGKGSRLKIEERVKIVTNGRTLELVIEEEIKADLPSP